MPMLGQSAQMEQCKLAVQVCTITKFNKQEENTMVKTICEKIMTKEITSVELKSVLGKELYICNGNCWTDVLDEFGFTYSSEQFCQYIADYEAWAELNNVYVEILEGKAEFRSSINAAKELLKEWLEYNELEKFRSLYSTLSARQKEAVLCILRYSEILDMDLMCPTTSELSLLGGNHYEQGRQSKAKINQGSSNPFIDRSVNSTPFFIGCSKAYRSK